MPKHKISVADCYPGVPGAKGGSEKFAPEREYAFRKRRIPEPSRADGTARNNEAAGNLPARRFGRREAASPDQPKSGVGRKLTWEVWIPNGLRDALPRLRGNTVWGQATLGVARLRR